MLKTALLKEGAVFAISQMELEESIDGLIGLARAADDEEVRKKAIFWLGETGDPRALEVLIEIIKGK